MFVLRTLKYQNKNFYFLLISENLFKKWLQYKFERIHSRGT